MVLTLLLEVAPAGNTGFEPVTRRFGDGCSDRTELIPYQLQLIRLTVTRNYSTLFSSQGTNNFFVLTP